MKLATSLVTILCTAAALGNHARAQGAARLAPAEGLRIVLLGTAGGPTINAERQGIGTLVIAGPETLLFDAGRGITTSMARLSIDVPSVTKVFITHLHSDHVISLPELWLFPWASQLRKAPLRVWGPKGTNSMLAHLQQAFAFDVHIRRDVDEKFSAEGVRMLVTEIAEGVVYEANGAKVTAFVVDHGPIKPAFGYRVDYHGHSVVMSGDTKMSENLVKYAQGVDVLIHDVARSKQDPLLVGRPDEILLSGFTREQLRTIAAHHTDAAEAAQVFQRAKPKLAVFSHANPSPGETLATVQQTYPGRVQFGADLMIIDIADDVTVRPFSPLSR
jgi:ribonuclease Z